MNMQQFTAGDYQPAAIPGRIETLLRRIRTRLRILSGEELGPRRGEDQPGVADWEVAQRIGLPPSAAQLLGNNQRPANRGLARHNHDRRSI